LGASQYMIDAKIGRWVVGDVRPRQIHARTDDRCAQMMNEANVGTVYLFHQADMSKSVVHVAIATAVVGIVKEDQIACGRLVFEQQTVFLYVAIDGLNVIIIIALNDAAKPNSGLGKKCPDGTRTVISKGFLAHLEP